MFEVNMLFISLERSVNSKYDCDSLSTVVIHEADVFLFVTPVKAFNEDNKSI